MEEAEEGELLEQGRSSALLRCTDLDRIEEGNLQAEGADQVEQDMSISEGTRVAGGLEALNSTAESSSPVKRPLPSLEGAVVEISYKRLPSESRKKLQELLLLWASWHASQPSTEQELEDGKETYYPAANVESAHNVYQMHFWADKPSKRARVAESEIPLYDRGCDTVLRCEEEDLHTQGVREIPEEASRCFNCGSYTHELRECTRQRDFAAISSARKLRQSKKSSIIPRRYYQEDQFDGIQAGVLSMETRQSLGIGENDPPPWLKRMREIGYPPGYLGFEDGEPSGITMFDDATTTEEGEIVDMEPSSSERQRSAMTVAFPGFNAPIPEAADKRLWIGTFPSMTSERSRQKPVLQRSMSDGANEFQKTFGAGTRDATAVAPPMG